MEFEYIFDDIDICECVGMFEDEYVYDIEVDDDTHTFIGNDILVHNSLYISLTPMMESIGFDPFADEQKTKNFILHVDEIHIKPLYNTFLEKYAKRYQVKNLHDFELETISKTALFIAKKNYLNNIVWEDGVNYPSQSYYYPKGVEIIRSSTPPFVRRNVYRVINYLFSTPKPNVQEVMRIVKQVKKEFELADIEDISMTSSCTNYSQKVIDDTVGIKYVKGTYFSVKAACFHNYLLNKNSEYKKRYDMIKSGRIKYYYCKEHSLGERVFAYLRSFHPTEIVTKERVSIDTDVQFEKTFLSIVNKFIKPMNMPKITKRISVLVSLFNFDESEEEDDDDFNEDEFNNYK